MEGGGINVVTETNQNFRDDWINRSVRAVAGVNTGDLDLDKDHKAIIWRN